MADLPGPHAAIPHTPGAHHVPKWAWIAGGAGVVGAVALMHHRQGQQAVADAAAMNDPGTAGYNAGAVDSSVASPTGDPWATVPNGTSYALPNGSAPIVIGDPPLPDTTTTSPDTPGTAQLPPITIPIQLGPINNNPDPQAPVTGGGSAHGVRTRTPKPAKNHHGAKGLKPHHQKGHPQAPVHATGPGIKGKKPPKNPATGGKPALPKEAPSQPMQATAMVDRHAPAPSPAKAPGVQVPPPQALTPGAMAMPLTGGGLPGTHAPPMTMAPSRIPAPPPVTTHASMSQARNAAATTRAVAAAKPPARKKK